MTRTLLMLTTRQLLGRKRAVLIGLAMLLPVLIAVVYRSNSSGDSTFDRAQVAIDTTNGLILTMLLPLIALVLGTAALGAEIEDGTVVFLLTKPVPRRRILAVKMAVSTAATAVLTVPATVLTAWLMVGGSRLGIAAGLGLGALAAAVVYPALFVALSAMTSRALVIGLVYVFVWEGIASNLFSGLRWISVREYALAWADMLIEASAPLTSHLGAATAVVASLIVVVGAFVLGARALERFEIGERA